MAEVLKLAGVTAVDDALPPKIRARHAVSRNGKRSTSI